MARRPIRISGDGSDYVGKRLLVGITYEDHAGRVFRHEQFLGIILEAGDAEIVVERNDTRERMSLPPELTPAGRGRYRLRSTRAVVVDPDYLATWAMKAPGPVGEEGEAV